MMFTLHPEIAASPTPTGAAARHQRQAARLAVLDSVGARELRDLVGPILPGETIHLLSRGAWSASHVIDHCLDALASPVRVILAMWALEQHHVARLLSHLDAARVASIEALIDSKAIMRKPAAVAMLRARAKVRLAPVHAKIIVLRGASGGIVITGSANMCTNPRMESTVVVHSAAIADFYAAVILGRIESGTVIDESDLEYAARTTPADRELLPADVRPPVLFVCAEPPPGVVRVDNGRKMLPPAPTDLQRAFARRTCHDTIRRALRAGHDVWTQVPRGHGIEELEAIAAEQKAEVRR